MRLSTPTQPTLSEQPHLTITSPSRKHITQRIPELDHNLKIMPTKPTPYVSTTFPATFSVNNINRLTRTLSTATGLDATLATACYTSLFLHTQIPWLTGGLLRASGRLPTGPSSLKALYATLEDHRIVSRLFGLIPLYTTAVEAWRKPHRDPAVKALLYASLAAGTVFQVLENVAVLTRRGVLRGEGARRREGWLWVLANRVWLAQLGLEILRLARVRQLRFREELGAERVMGEEKAGGNEGQGVDDGVADGVAESTQQLMELSTKRLVRVQSEELEKRWWREMYLTALSFPLAIHWSFIDGMSPVSEALFAGCGMVAGVIGLQDAWEEAA